jgi:hypothetical protein
MNIRAVQQFKRRQAGHFRISAKKQSGRLAGRPAPD